MTIRFLLVSIAAVFLCGATPVREHPLGLVVPDPDRAVRLAWFETTPDETVLDKIKGLELHAREANPKAEGWSIYLTPAAASISVKGWQADLNRPGTPLPEASLGDCLKRLSDTAGLRYEVLKGRILINVADKKTELNQEPAVMPRKPGEPQR